MKKRITVWFLPVIAIIGFLFIGVQKADAEDHENAVVLKAVYLRSQPTTFSHQIRSLDSGEQVKVISKENSYWYKIKDQNGTIGYVSSLPGFLKVDGTSSVGRTSSNLSTTPTNTKSTSSNTSNTSKSSNTMNATKQRIDSIIQTGMKYLGTPYEFGSNRSTTKTFDCSDFVRHVFKKATGVTLPSDSRQQANYVKKIGKTSTNWRSLKTGDLLFFMSYRGANKSNYVSINKAKQTVTHVGIYMGNGKVLHTYSKDSGGVRVDNIGGNHWEYRFIFGGSALK